MKKLMLAALALLACLSFVGMAAAQDAQTPAEICEAAPADEPATREFTQAEDVLQPDVDYRAVLCTDAGPIYVDLLEDETPITVNNFVFLAQQGYYNSTTFHRVIEGFMAQGGDPTATGSGGPGYQFEDEFLPSLNFDAPGLLAMANAGPGTNGSQFFITTVPTPHLNQLHTIFGRVIKGQANVEDIQLRDPATASEPGTTLNTVVIIEDPALVEIETSETPVTAEEAAAALGEVNTIITPDVSSILTANTTSQTTDEVVEAAPEEARETLAEFLTQHNHEFRVRGEVANTGCDLETVQFASVSYTLDAFATADDAAAALADETMATLPTLSGYGEGTESENLSQPYFQKTETVCDREMTHILTYWQRGRFVATAEAVIPADDADAAGILDRILVEFVGLGIFEPFLTDVLYRDIR